MVERRQRIASVQRLPAIAALAIVIAAVALGIGPVLLLGGSTQGGRLFDAYLWQVLRFTLLQAGLSTLISVGLAIPVSWSLFRTRFPGRDQLLSLLAVPQTLPVIAAVLGIVAIFGKSGLLAHVTGLSLDIYGLTGILIAHVFFNLPFATRLLMQRLEAIAPENWRLATQLGFSQRDRLRLIGWPAMQGGIAGAASLIFLLCTTSFAVVLTLGGGPRATTLEVAIYQALRFDFDPARAGSLALVQLLLCGTLIALAGRFALDAMAAQGNTGTRHGFVPVLPGLFDVLLIAGAGLLVAAPIAMLIADGLMAEFAWIAIARATATSIVIGILAAITSVTLALPLAYAQARANSPLTKFAFSLAGVLGLVVPPAVLATGWFILAVKSGLSAVTAFCLVVAMNSLTALPFAQGTLAPAIRSTVLPNDRLCQSLGLAGWSRFRLVDVHQMRGPLGFAAALCFGVSLGDLTAISLFGSQDLVTLPSLIYAQMGSYRIQSATATALVLMALTMAVILLADRRMGRR